VLPGGFSFQKQKLTVLIRTRIRKTCPLSVKPSAAASFSFQMQSKETTRRATELGLQTASLQASRKRFRSSQQAVGQNKSVGEGRPVTMAPEPGFLNALQACVTDLKLASQLARESRHLESHLYSPPTCSYRVREMSVVPGTIAEKLHDNHAIRIPSSHPLLTHPFHRSSPPSSLRGTKFIPHAHNPDICFQGCELLEVLDRLDIEL
jgi:hypothetical protein